MNALGFEPDFENLKTVLKGGRGYRVPNVELVIDREIQEGFLGRPVDGVAAELEFRYQAGYDYLWISVGMIDPAGTVNKDLLSERSPGRFEGADRRQWAEEHSGAIRDRSDLERYAWPRAEELDLGPFAEVAARLPAGMKVIAVLGKIFTAAWELLGFERFCEALLLDPRFVEDLVQRIAAVQLEVFYRLIDRPEIGAFWVPDDVAFRSGLMVSPQWLRERIFPYYRRMAVACRQADKPIIYHSDGDLNPLLDTILETGFHALHPVEPESMDIYALRRRVGRRLCLLGNISVNTLTVGSRREVRELVRDRVQRLGHDGAYCVGSSNSVPHYVPLANYRAMLEASAEFGLAPGRGGEG